MKIFNKRIISLLLVLAMLCGVMPMTVSAVDRDEEQVISMQYDDHYDITDKTVEIIDAGDSVVALEGNYLVATGIGEAIIRVDGQIYCAIVEKAKINIITIMGQSNAGNHFANATSDVSCPIGTAYWWGNGKGINATEPIDYTQPSMGFHTPLLAELYAQSVAAGEPVKNVLIWQEGITSKNGQSIVKWAATENDTSGTDATAAMIKNCVAYYERYSDKYEIVGNGVYWLQGEADVEMAPEKYTALFMAMWSDLKKAGAEYLAFLRVRKGVKLNDEYHEDLGYTGSLTAQFDMVNRNCDMFMATTITENWVGNASTEQSVDIHKYLTLVDEYGDLESYADSYGNTATIQNGILTTTMKEIYGSNNKCHYGKFGYGIIGADAAYNMYKALHTNAFSIVKADTSGKAGAQLISNPGDIVTIDITNLEENLAFRASSGSAAGVLKVTVKNGANDITDRVIATDTNTFGTVDTDLLRKYDNPVIIVTYTTVYGSDGSVTYLITDKTPKPPNVYYWDFENDLYARDENGEIVNAFNTTALNGSYTVEDGMLKATNLQLAIDSVVQLDGTENWSVEWKLGQVNDKTTGFLLCNTENSAVGTKAIYMTTTGKTSISDYADSKGYRNFYTNDTAFASGDVFKITNHYDSENKRSILSLWINGKLAVTDYQNKGAINKANDNLLDMSGYPLSGDFAFKYLGCKGIANFSVTCEIDYIKITTSINKTTTVTPPTCTEKGYTTYTCECGESYVGDYVDATGHTYKNGICTGCGEEGYDGLDLNGLNVLCLGDSITAGQGLTTETRWTNVLVSKYGWNLTNKSQGGISLSSYYYTANGKSDVSIAKKAEILKTMTTKPDVIIVWGGHNDTSYRYSPLGTWDDETTDSFKGALKYIAELADEYAPDATLFVLTPLWTTEAPSTLKVPENTTDNNWMFVDAIYEGAEAYGWIPINMDLCGITPFTKSGLLLDNIHPNEAGTEKIVEYLSEELASYGANSKKQTILFNHSSVSIENGKTTTLKAVLSPRSGNGSPVFTWSSSNSSVATVDANGKITAVAHGNATITATADNDVSATVQVYVAEGEHTYESTVTAPTCTEQGYTTYTCACGDSYVDSFVDALGHKFGQYISNDDATVTSDGTKTAVCERDGCKAADTVTGAGTKLLLGDMNNDKCVDTDDAIYLLRHILMPDSYCVKQSANVNGDDVADTDDAIYLLRHVLLPNSYPLKPEK